ncbi:hypothetical protein LMTR3_07610 [Bradyrhizobium sp. LMTR 3]|nr:hypothetical protein LMTR3_07610 [Bradyrhizobium sp. LMTR 3]
MAFDSTWKNHAKVVLAKNRVRPAVSPDSILTPSVLRSRIPVYIHITLLARDWAVAQGSNRQTDAKALGLCQQVAKLACRILFGAAPTMCNNSASISDEVVGLARVTALPRIIFERRAVGLRASQSSASSDASIARDALDDPAFAPQIPRAQTVFTRCCLRINRCLPGYSRGRGKDTIETSLSGHSL